MPILPSYDLSKIPDFGEIPPGKYLVEVMYVKKSPSNSGHLMLTWTWKITKGDYAGKSLLSYTSLQDHMQDIVRRYLIAIGYSGDVEPDTDDLAGKKACLIIGKCTITSKVTGKPIEVPDVLAVLPAERFDQLTLNK